MPFAIAAAAAFIFSLTVPSILLKNKRPSQPESQQLGAALSFYMFPYILRLASAEFIAIMGFLLAMLYGQDFYFPFWGTALIAFAFAFPNETKILRAVHGPNRNGPLL